MSKLLEMSEDFNTSSRQQAADIEQTVKAEPDEHAKSIKSAVKESEQKTRSDIAGLRNVIRWLILKDWMRAALIIFLVLGGMHAIVWGQGRIIEAKQKTIEQQKREIGNQEQTIERLAVQTWGITLHEGKKGRFIILSADQAIDTDWKLGDGKIIKLIEKGG